MKILSLLLVTLLLFSGCQSSAKKAQDKKDVSKRAALHYSLGIDALRKGFLPKAFEELLLSDSIAANQPATLDAIAHAWRIRGNTQQAKKYYERAVHANAGAATHNNYGSLLIELGDYHLAIRHLNIALEDPRYRKQAYAFSNLGDAKLGLGRFEEAIAAYRKAHMIAPKQAFPQLREASAYVQHNRLNYAQALYETILRQHPGNQQALSAYIQLLKNTGGLSTAKPYIKAFMQHTTDPLQKAWAKDELQYLSFTKDGNHE
ncbi:MAG: tetratricopeptide repeat protein [Mariprofundaceae bacterium]|nr:tetratricopeptide repeat protein [Mariprofundaceae bacterium]